MATLNIKTKPRKQSGVIPFRYHKGVLQILMVRTTGSNKWGFPKGKVEKHLSKKESALTEAWEEAGVKGEVLAKLGRYSYFKNKTQRVQLVDMYLMQVTKVHTSYPEMERERKWFEPRKVTKKLSRELQEIFDTAMVELDEV